MIRLLRVTVPHGTRADLTGVIPHLAGVGISTPRSTAPSETCGRRGAVDVCTQAEEACPMPAATWRFRLRKLAGPAGEVKLEFVVARPPPRRGARDPRLQRAVRPVLGARIHVPPRAVDVVAEDGTLWVAGPGTVSRLDPATGRVEARIRTPDTGDYSQIAFVARSAWVTTGGGVVYRIDSLTNRVVATVHVGGSLQGIAVGGGRVWVTRTLQGPGQLIRIDPRTNKVAGPPIKVGPGPGQVTYGHGTVWVQNTSPRSVMRIDPTTGHVTTVIGVVPVAYGSFVVGAIAVGYGSLWSAVNDTLIRVDPRTGQVIASVQIPRAQEIAIGDGEVWVLAAPRSSSPTLFYPIKHTAALWEVDPNSNRIIGKPIRLDALQPIAVTAADRNVWVADYATATVTRLRLLPAK
jgi:DNA-binding beta-propeller fold protein YncE